LFLGFSVLYIAHLPLYGLSWLSGQGLACAVYR